jgi:hypothetical protein
VRRYLGNTWLSVGEAARTLGLPNKAIERMIDDGRLQCIWRHDRMLGCGSQVFDRPYVSKEQVERMQLSFAVLDAAFSDWPPSD